MEQEKPKYISFTLMLLPSVTAKTAATRLETSNVNDIQLHSNRRSGSVYPLVGYWIRICQDQLSG
jgi:hypothetical protein